MAEKNPSKKETSNENLKKKPVYRLKLELHFHVIPNEETNLPERELRISVKDNGKILILQKTLQPFAVR